MRLDLNGKWKFKETLSDKWLAASVPGCNYLDLLHNGLIHDPFIGLNEKEVQWVGDRDWEYKRDFAAGKNILSCDFINLHMESLDTLASVFLNDNLILSSNNAHRIFIVDIKPYLHEGLNSIRILFSSPVRYIREGQRLKKYPSSNMGIRGVPHIRKNQSHFGWDWGPCLPLAGITRDIYIKGTNKARITDVRVLQEHFPDKVRLNIDISATLYNRDDCIKAQVKVTSPDGKGSSYEQGINNDTAFLGIDIINPEIWEANGMSERSKQPLYKLEVALENSNIVTDFREMKVGLRTVLLNTAPDQWGNNFQFSVNGVPIFARGANWIPADSFATRITKEKTDYLIRSMKEGNMNMVRVWGGGYYESEEFYDACDKYGILIWQDFMFACMPYDFSNQVFLDNLRYEVRDNVTRLRNRASLALWSGNNEIEVLSKLWFHRRDFIRSTGEFFYNTLPRWVKESDNVTPYWAGSPSSGTYMEKVNSDKMGDTHLWQVWHGLKPYNYYRKRFTRFCSEFGFESLPDMETIEGFANNKKDYDLNSKVMLNHQKCKSGNNKILFYIASRFRIPEKFEHIVYLSQISQMECVRDATEHWRRNMGRCNGALFWQLNDCWPVSSWSGIDYNGRWKALQYHARKFNAPLALSIDDNGTLMKVSVVNDTSRHYEAVFHYKVITFDGITKDSGSYNIQANPLTSSIVFEMDYQEILIKADIDIKKNTVFAVCLDNDDMSMRTALFVKEKDACLIRPIIKKDLSISNGNAIIRLISNTYARFVRVNVRGVSEPLSDNYFDLLPHKEKIVTVPLKNISEVKDTDISVLSLNELEPKQLGLVDDLLRLKIRLTPINIIYAIAQALS